MQLETASALCADSRHMLQIRGIWRLGRDRVVVSKSHFSSFKSNRWMSIEILPVLPRTDDFRFISLSFPLGRQIRPEKCLEAASMYRQMHTFLPCENDAIAASREISRRLVAPRHTTNHAPDGVRAVQRVQYAGRDCNVECLSIISSSCACWEVRAPTSL